MTLLLDSPVDARRRFLGNVNDVLGRSSTRAIWTPGGVDGLAVSDPAVASRTWTYATTPNGRLSPLGKGYSLSFNGTTDYLSAPDATDLSFGNGTTDTAFTIAALFKGPAAATLRAFVSKHNTANREYFFELAADNNLYMQATDESAAVGAFRASNANPTTTAWSLLSGTYSAATGGATAANDMTLYQNGAVLASTATNNAAYVAMENLGAVVEISAQSAHTAGFLLGSLALVIITQANLAIGGHKDLTQLCRNYFGVPA